MAAALRYLSTQGGAKGKAYTFEEAVLAGWAEDGGMILPETMPAVSEVTLRSWVGLSYPELAVAILRLFIRDGEASRADVEAIVKQSFSCFAEEEVRCARTACCVSIHWPAAFLLRDLGLSPLWQALC